MYDLLWLNLHFLYFWVLVFWASRLGTLDNGEISVKPTVFGESLFDCVLFIFPFTAVFAIKIRESNWAFSWRNWFPNILEIWFRESVAKNGSWRLIKLFFTQRVCVLVGDQALKCLWSAVKLMLEFLNIFLDMFNFPIILAKSTHKVVFQKVSFFMLI